MATPIMEFKKGDTQVHYFQVPIESWAPGGVLWFIAKPDTDNDGTDAAAVINKSFDDTKVVLSDHEMYDASFATYELEFVANDIVNVTFEPGETARAYFGEFVIVDANNAQQTFPSNDEFIDVKIFADLKRGGV